VDKVIIAFAAWLLGTVGLVGLVLLIAYLTPEKFEGWSRIITRATKRIPAIYRVVQRFIVRRYLQNRVNRALKRAIAKDQPPFRSKAIRVEWVDGSETREDFIQRRRVVVCLRKAENPSENFVRATYAFVSTSLLFRTKRYLSEVQREALDLFVTSKVLEESDDVLRDFFLSEYLLPSSDDAPEDRLGDYFRSFETLARAGLFYEFLLDELDLVGRRVFGLPYIKQIGTDVDGVIGLAAKVAGRERQERVNLTFNKAYIRCGLVIVGSPEKLTADGSTYSTYVMRVLRPRGVESVYLLGFVQNRHIIDRVARDLSPTYQIFRRHNTGIILASGMGARSYSISLASNPTSAFEPLHPELATRSVAPAVPEPLPGPEERVLGTVHSLHQGTYGFIRSDAEIGADLYFKMAWCLKEDLPLSVGDRVEFSVKRYPDGQFSASGIRLVLRGDADSSSTEPTGYLDDGMDERLTGELDREIADSEVAPERVQNVAGVVERYGDRGFGFIKLDPAISADPAWFHISSFDNPPDHIRPGLSVHCDVRRLPDGRIVADSVRFGATGEDDEP